MKNRRADLTLDIIPKQRKMLLSKSFLHIYLLSYYRGDTVDESASSPQSGQHIKLGRLNTSCREQVYQDIYMAISQNRDNIFSFQGGLLDKPCEMFGIPIRLGPRKTRA